MKNKKNKIKKHDLTLALDYLINGKPVKYITEKEFQKDGIKLTEKVPEYYELFFNSYAINPILGKKEKSAVLIAPILFGSARWACEVVVQIRPNRVGFYLHEAEEIKKLLDVFKTVTEDGTPQRASRLIIARYLASVNNNLGRQV